MNKNNQQDASTGLCVFKLLNVILH